jgi:hypothetical protein
VYSKHDAMEVFPAVVAHATVLSPRVARHDDAASAGSPQARTRVTGASGSQPGFTVSTCPAADRAVVTINH